jgi:signal transduction histidine kinase
MNRKYAIYLAAWLAYLFFGFAMFPLLEVAVMLASIPLAMLGAWLFGHRGAYGTTLLAIPVHFALLIYYANPGMALREAFNPFGIFTSLAFSHSTALLKTTRARYMKLNNSLGELVEERTRELKQVTTYLQETENREYSNIMETLLEVPLKRLISMKNTSLLLTNHLASSGHRLTKQAEDLAAQLDACIADIQALEGYETIHEPKLVGLKESLQSLTGQLTLHSGVEVLLKQEANWDWFKPEENHHLCEIVHEAVSNALRHGKPSRIEIGIEQDQKRKTLYIENNGDPIVQARKEGMGMPLMRYRASKIGATIALGTTDVGHTRCTCLLPNRKEGPSV